MAKRKSRRGPASPSSKPTSVSRAIQGGLFNVPDLLISALLLAAVFFVYYQVLHFDFVTLDDPEYVTENQHVQAGLTLAGVAWAFKTSAAGSWFPITWLSHMLDCQLFGLDSGWHHFTNVCLHALSAMFWFVALDRITRARWRSAMVAFLFGLHPLHVESVAWVCERKDVLSAMFFALTLWSYADYTSKPRIGRYLLTLLLFCLGLMSKPMLVMLPLVLILLDRWPTRAGPKNRRKDPFLCRVHCGFDRHVPRSFVGSRAAFLAADSYQRSIGKCSGLICGVYLSDDLAREDGCLLPVPVGIASSAGYYRGNGHWCNYSPGDPRVSASPVPYDRLALVSVNARSRYWSNSSGRAGASGSVYVYSDDWHFHRRSVGYRRGPRRPTPHSICRFCGGVPGVSRPDVGSGRVLAR